MASRAQQAEQQQAGQQALGSVVAPAVAGAWPLLDPHDIRGTLPAFIRAIQAIVRHFGPMSSVAAMDHYRASRLAAGVPGVAPVRIASGATDQHISDVITDAVSTLYGPVDAAAEQAALEVVSAEAEKLVLDYGRQTMQDGVAADPVARGWARVPHEGACAFCLMLATRSAGGEPIFYKSAEAAGQRDATTKWADAKGYVNSFHPNCRCTVEPVFGIYEPTALTRQADALWKTSTKGKSGKDALKAFRRAVEGRQDGPTRAQKPAKG